MFAQTEPYRQELGNGLVLRSLGDENDIERLAAFNGAIHGEGVAALTRELVLHHPNTKPEGWLFIEDETENKIVSSLCLIPWTWRYEEVELKAGEMGIVGTLKEYRHQGLIRRLAVRFAELLRQGGYDISQIQGIPYFYRQFGYEYAVPLENNVRVDLDLVPDAPQDETPGYSFRQATLDDVPVLKHQYDEAMNDLSIRAVRDEASWRYLLGESLHTDTAADTWVVENNTGEPVGYFRIARKGFGKGMIVNEVSRLSSEQATATLCHLRQLCAERGKPYIRLNLSANSTLARVARHLGAHDPGSYAWQIRFMDVAGLLGKLAPILERRIAASSFAGLTQKVCINLYREAFELCFQEGRLAAVEPLGFSDLGGIRIPPRLAVPLILGYRNREELSKARHDVSIAPDWKHLVDVLFPKVDSFIYSAY